TLRPSPRSTLFPYTTLFRSGLARRRPDVDIGGARPAVRVLGGGRRGHLGAELEVDGRDRRERRRGRRDGRAGEPCRTGADGLVRSEEHTSELQSLAYLVCRL